MVRLGRLVKKWLKDCTTVGAIQDQVALEQLLNVLPKDICQRKENKISVEASVLVDD